MHIWSTFCFNGLICAVVCKLVNWHWTNFFPHVTVTLSGCCGGRCSCTVCSFCYSSNTCVAPFVTLSILGPLNTLACLPQVYQCLRQQPGTSHLSGCWSSCCAGGDTPLTKGLHNMALELLLGQWFIVRDNQSSPIVTIVCQRLSPTCQCKPTTVICFGCKVGKYSYKDIFLLRFKDPGQNQALHQKRDLWNPALVDSWSSTPCSHFEVSPPICCGSLGPKAWQQTRDLFAANQPQRSTY